MVFPLGAISFVPIIEGGSHFPACTHSPYIPFVTSVLSIQKASRETWCTIVSEVMPAMLPISNVPAGTKSMTIPSAGRVHVAYDSYRAGNYDVLLRTRESDGSLSATIIKSMKRAMAGVKKPPLKRVA